MDIKFNYKMDQLTLLRFKLFVVFKFFLAITNVYCTNQAQFSLKLSLKLEEWVREF